ncbi:MAG: wax ester/triacylglycerol synthase domain-containing protein, partial [Lapillicoccus sp.]
MPERKVNGSPEVDRVSASDEVTLATDCGPAPTNLGVALLFAAGVDLTYATVRSTLEGRLPRVRRLRQRLVRTPPGCGRPVWVDDAGFDLAHHLSEVSLPTPPARSPHAAADGDRRLLEVVADLVTAPLPRHRPLWAARWVRGWAPDRAALVLVMHHALADGIGGLAVLAALSDGGADPEDKVFPKPPMARGSLARAAHRDRVTAWRRLPSRVRAGRQGLSELAGSRPPALAART